jgi:glycosyltransferase involved in cell wall biosynthesis
MKKYAFNANKSEYLAFLGRIAPVKGTHLAIEVAKKSGIPLKIAGEVQPMFQSYYDTMVKPHIDGKFIEYIGEADLSMKNELLGNSIGMLFPITWDEPFGLVMLESMACGTPVFALDRGSVPEVVGNSSGVVCTSVDQLVKAVQLQKFNYQAVRQHVTDHFSSRSMASNYARLYHARLNPAA